MGVEIAPEFGYVILVGVATWVLNMWMGINVGRARKQYGVKYPAMYSDKEPMFNCIQRAHQNTLEQIPLFLMLMVFAAIRFPTLSAASGVVFLLGRIVYAQGYYTGKPENRNRGAFGYFGLLTMLGCSVLTAVNLLGWW